MLGFRLKGPFEVTRGHERHEIAPITHADAPTEFTTTPRPDMQSGPGHRRESHSAISWSGDRTRDGFSLRTVRGFRVPRYQ